MHIPLKPIFFGIGHRSNILQDIKTESSITMVNKFGQKYHCELPKEVTIS